MRDQIGILEGVMPVPRKILIQWASCIITIFLTLFMLPENSRAANPPRVGVIPFENITKSKNISWFSQGVAKAASLELAKNPKLKVIEIEQIKRVFTEMGLVIGSGITLAVAQKVGSNLHSDYLVIGNFQQFGDDIKIDAHIVSISSGLVLHSEKVVGKVSEIFSHQDVIVEAISRSMIKILLGQETKPTSPPPPPKKPKPKPKPRPAVSRSAEDEATRALIAQQRGLAPPAGEVTSEPTTFRSKEDEATRALMQRKQKSMTASEWYNKGVRLNDNSDEEIAYYREAIRVDPTFAPPYYNLGFILYNRGKKEEAIEQFEKFLIYSKNPSEKSEIREMLQKLGAASSSPPPPQPKIHTPKPSDDLPVFYEDRGPGMED